MQEMGNTIRNERKNMGGNAERGKRDTGGKLIKEFKRDIKGEARMKERERGGNERERA